MPTLEPLIKLIEVSKQYPSPDGSSPLPVLESLSLEIQTAEFVAIVGPSGSGKSTLLHLIGGLDTPTSGRILFRDQNLSALDEPSLAQVRNRQIGFVFQSHYLLPQCTVLENVLVPTLAAKPGASQKQDDNPEKHAERLLRRLGLADRLHHLPGQLSGGERQRVAVARALINRPSLLLADEPTGSLDQTSAGELGRLLAELNSEEHVTVVLVTHSPALARAARRVLVLTAGRLAPETDKQAPSNAV